MFAPRRITAPCDTSRRSGQELGFRTIFNLLGPLTNPAGAQRQVMGVFSTDRWVEPIWLSVLGALGSVAGVGP